MTALDPAHLWFRPLTFDDLPMLFRWHHLPHAEPWFGKGRSWEELVAEYTTELDGTLPIHDYLVHYDGVPIGEMKWVRCGDFDWLMANYQLTDPNTVNCDVLIGEPDFVHCGLGAPMIRRFLREVVFLDDRFQTCVIDPEEANTIAIKAYAKVGFTHLRTVVDEADDAHGERLHLMVLQRERLVNQTNNETPPRS